MSEPFIAEIKIVATNFAPRGWAFCNGQLLPISQNTALFSLVGTVYGGDGRTTMGLPNLQGRAPMHPGRGPGLTSRRLGERVGTSSVTLHENQMPAHTHSLTSFATADSTGPSSAKGVADGPFFGDKDGDKVSMSEDMINEVGGNQPHNNLQPFLGIYYVIALQGLYPSRS